MSHMAQPEKTPTEMYRVVHRWRRDEDAEWHTHSRYYWTLTGATNYGLPRASDSANRQAWIERASVLQFRRLPG